MISMYKKFSSYNVLKNSFIHVSGVGKTTLVKKVCEKLEEMNWACEGFYTEELREDGQRVGFDVVTLDGARGSLARVVDRYMYLSKSIHVDKSLVYIYLLKRIKIKDQDGTNDQHL